MAYVPGKYQVYRTGSNTHGMSLVYTMDVSTSRGSRWPAAHTLGEARWFWLSHELWPALLQTLSPPSALQPLLDMMQYAESLHSGLCTSLPGLWSRSLAKQVLLLLAAKRILQASILCRRDLSGALSLWSCCVHSTTKDRTWGLIFSQNELRLFWQGQSVGTSNFRGTTSSASWSACSFSSYPEWLLTFTRTTLPTHCHRVCRIGRNTISKWCGHSSLVASAWGGWVQ